MLEMNKNPLVQGLTTNPSLMRQSGVTDYRSFCKEILKEINSKPVSFEVFADEFDAMERQAQEIKTWGSNVYVKIPITNSKGESSIPLIKKLSSSGVKLNVTALFTMEQIEQTCAAVKGGAPSVVSVFAGRIADAGYDPIPLMVEGAKLCRSLDPNIELLWASTREAINIIQAEMAGCHIITAPNDVIKKVAQFRKSLKQYSLETVQAFKRDAEAAGYSL